MDLFHSGAPLAVQIPDAELLFYERLDLGDDSALIQQLIRNTEWQEESITI